VLSTFATRTDVSQNDKAILLKAEYYLLNDSDAIMALSTPASSSSLQTSSTVRRFSVAPVTAAAVDAERASSLFWSLLSGAAYGRELGSTIHC
jgi:hypothetical protein